MSRGDRQCSCTQRPRNALLLQKSRALAQFCEVQLGHEPIAHAGLSPVDQVVSLTRELVLLSDPGVVRGPDEQINKVLAALVNQRRDRPVIEVIRAATDQSKSLFGQIFRRW